MTTRLAAAQVLQMPGFPAPSVPPHACSYLFQGAEPGPPYLTGDHLVENAGGWAQSRGTGGGGMRWCASLTAEQREAASHAARHPQHDALRRCRHHPCSQLLNGRGSHVPRACRSLLAALPRPPSTALPPAHPPAGKMVLLDKLLPKLQNRGSRVLIFSQVRAPPQRCFNAGSACIAIREVLVGMQAGRNWLRHT